MIRTLLLGWILTWFNLDNVITEGVNQIFNTQFDVSIYWIAFLVIGFIIHIINEAR